MAKTKTTSLTEGDIRKQIFNFGWPVFVSSVFNELYNVTNSLIVGNYVSLKALSAVSACAWICNIFSHAFYGVGMGTGIIVARYYGAKDEKNLTKTLDSAIIFAVVFGLGSTILSELFLPTLMRWCNISPDLFDLAESYLRIYMLGHTAVLTYQVCMFILRSFGDTKHQLYYSIISSLVNLFLGMILVRVFNLSVIGTAIATLVAQIVLDVLALRLMMNYDVVNIDLKNLDFSFDIVKQICSLGIPASLQNMLIALSSMMVQSYVNTFSNEVIAGIGVAEKIINWSMMPTHSFSSATVSLVAQNLGAKKYDRVQESIKQCLTLSTICNLFAMSVIWLLAPWLVGRFNSSSAVIGYGTDMIRIAIFGAFFLNLSHICNAACRAAGNVKVPMMIAVFSQVLCKYFFVFIGLKLYYDVHVLYLGSAFGYTMAGILAYLYFFKGKWSLENGLRPS